MLDIFVVLASKYCFWAVKQEESFGFRPLHLLSRLGFCQEITSGAAIDGGIWSLVLSIFYSIVKLEGSFAFRYHHSHSFFMKSITMLPGFGFWLRNKGP